MSTRLKINEIFFSVQGESTHAGRPCVFVRLSGCPLRCTYCDTAYAFYEGDQREIDDIIAEVRRHPCQLVEITGGEPLAQKNCVPLAQRLVSLGFEVLIETSGAYDVSVLPPEVSVILDIKTPGSGELKKMHWDNMGALRAGQDEVKFVICNRADFDFAIETARQYRLFDRVTVLCSAEFGKLPMKDLAQWILDSGLPFRMQTQLHKFIWGPEVRGV